MECSRNDRSMKNFIIYRKNSTYTHDEEFLQYIRMTHRIALQKMGNGWFDCCIVIRLEECNK